MSKVTRANLNEHLVEYQLKFIGKTLQDAIDNPNWINEWSISEEDYSKVKEYAIPLIKKIFKCNNEMARRTWAWFDLMSGLKIIK